MAWGSLSGLLLMLLSLFGLSVILVRRTGVGPAAAPLASLSVAALLLLAGGLLNILPLAGLVLLLGGIWGMAAEGVLARRSARPDPARAALDHPAAKVFWVLAVLLAVYFARLQPDFLNFDEYSSWGTAAKLMADNDQLYTLCDAGLPWQMTELAGLPLVSYFFQYFGDFAPWRAIYAADFVMLAACAAVAGCAKKARTALPLLLAALLVPTLLSVAGHTALLSTAWLEFLGDMPAGMLFGGAVAFWLGVRRAPLPARLLTLPVVLLAANIKSNTLVLALAAAGLIALDCLFFPADDAPRGAKAAASRLGFSLACLAAPLVQYLCWSAHITPLVLKNAQSGGMGDTAGASLPEVAVNGVRMLLGLPVTDYFEARRPLFNDYGAAMQSAFFTRNVSMLGTGVTVAVLALVLFALAILLGANARARVNALVLGLGSVLCFGGYYLMLWLSYAFLLKDSTPDNMASYARYFGSYYSGWLLIALAVLALACDTAPKAVFGRAAALVTGAAFALVFALQTEPQFTILGVSEGEYAAVRAERAVANAAAQQISSGERVFLIRQGDEGFYWFLYNQTLRPLDLVYGEGGATYGDPALTDAGDDPYFAPYTAEEFAAMVDEEDITWLLVARVDETFTASYGDLFTDDLAAAQQGPALYRVTAEGYAPAGALTGEGEA